MGKTDFFIQMFGGVVRLRDAASIIQQKNRNGKTGYYAFIGYDGAGRAVRRSLGLDKEKAYALLAEINQRMAQGKIKDAVNAFQVATDYEIKACLKKLEGHGATLTQAVDFFLEHHRPSAGHLTVDEASKIFVEHLKRLGRADAYVNAYEKVYLPHLCSALGKTRLVDVTQDDAESFIYKTKATLSSNTKAEYIGKLRTFFNTLAELNYYQKELNPFEKLKKPQASRDETEYTERDRCLPLEDVAVFLDYLSKNELWDILVIHAAVMFCGVRMEEVQRLSWREILLDQAKIDLTRKAAKKRHRRVIEIPQNALAMFTVCKEKMEDEWNLRTKNALKQKMQRIKAALREEKEKAKSAFGPLDFHTNFARVSFASYSYALHGAERTANAMGHSRIDILHTNYKEVVTKDDAQIYFQFLPLGIQPIKRQMEPQVVIKTVTP
ncbi:MAG: tyrosine-type recombinase/integrase [Verrucomicrobiota bacterium]